MAGERKLSVAPMMDWTDRHCRFFLRLITRHARLYTEMVTAAAIVHGDRDKLLRFSGQEHPVALQLGGSDPLELAEAARIAAEYGYDEINLNVGCPSDRVQSGRFGACLMAEPDVVGDCVQAMQNAVSVPVTVKCRIGIDDQDTEAALADFVGTIRQAGCRTIIVHARKAWLEGLSPKENRDVPPLDYDRVYRLKRTFPDLEIVINGGVETLDAVADHLSHVDGVMLGRAAYQNPYLLAHADHRFFDDPHPVPDRAEIVEAFLPYIDAEISQGARLHHMTRHILGLFQGQPGARAWRRHLTVQGVKADAGLEVLRDALAFTHSRAAMQPAAE